MRAASRSLPSFFASSNPAHLRNLRKTSLYLVKWGFSLEAAKNMPYYEFIQYAELIQEHYEEEKRAVADPPKQQVQEPQPIGANLPRG